MQKMAASLQFRVGILLNLVNFVIISHRTSAFNLDTKAPIVKEGPVDSYFGFSVALHFIKNLETNVGDPVIIVGAPRDNITHSEASDVVKKIVRPGTVYQCPYSSDTSCTALRIDIEDPSLEDDKNDQWMGVSVSSQGTEDGKAVVCAHRYKQASASFRWGLGICISMYNNLDEDEPYEPCRGKPKDKGHEQYGFCQAGISSTLSEEGDLVIGAPGPFNWRGAVFKNTVVKTLNSDTNWYNSPMEDPIPPRTEPAPATRFYSYLGMAVKIGFINGRKTYIAGAPRSDDVGHVLLFQMNGNEISIQPQHKLLGEQFGSYFGNDFAIADFNIDGHEDLAVGAPFYRDAGVGGAIYIYMGGPEGITTATKPIKIVSRKMKDQECAELDCHNARFGFTLAHVGDVDRDGFEDLAVGAPYEGGGAVYIFRGSASGLIKEYSQRISASQFVPVPRSFGSSIVGKMDVDQNGYPDVVVGAFSSDKIYLLRTRPVINVQAAFQALPDVVDSTITQCPSDGLPYNCFNLRVCFKFTAQPLDKFVEKIFLNYTIEAEKFSGAVISRVFFKGAPAEENYVLHKSMQLNEQSKPEFNCKEHLVYIIGSNRDFLNPILFRMTYRLRDARDPEMLPGGTLPDMNTFPILNEAITQVPLQVEFKKNCGADDKCESNLKVQGELSLPKNPGGDYRLRVGQDDEILLTVTVKNSGEDAHEATLTVTLPSSLIYRGTDDKGKERSCLPSVENQVICIVANPLLSRESITFGIRLDPNNATPSKEKLEIELAMNTTSIELNESDNRVVLKMEVIVETDLAVRGQSEPESIFYGGEIRGESAIKFEDQIGTEVKHKYEIKNVGRARVPRSTVFISWPYELHSEYSSGKHLLYLIEEPLLDGDVKCFIDRRMINPLKILSRSRTPLIPQNADNSTVEEDKSRRKRASEKTERSPDVRKMIQSSANVVTLDCDQKSARCYTFNCSLGELKPGRSFVIRIRSRLWNSTFLEDYPDVDAVVIYSKAEVKIDPELNIKQTSMDNDVLKIMTTATPEAQEPARVPIWVIIVSVVAGVIILVILILLLWKCGFFRRHQRDQMVTHKAKMQRKSYEDYHD